MEHSLTPISSSESAETAPPTFGARPVVLVLPSEDHVGVIAFAIQGVGVPCLLAFDSETLDYWRRKNQHPTFVVDLGSPWIRKAAAQLVDQGACVVGLSDDDEERLRAVTRGFEDAWSFTTPAKEMAVKLKARLISREAPALEIASAKAPLRIDSAGRRVWWKRREIYLSPILFDLLAYLVSRPRTTVPVQRLLEDVWHEAWAHPSKVHKAIGRLREALGPDSLAYIRSLRGHGYGYFPD